MNSKSIPIAFLPHVSLTPPAVVYTTHRRHPIFFWHKTHIRSVRCDLITDPCSKLLKVEYIDTRTCTTFIDKKSAELFLRKEIPDNEHEGKLFIEKVRNVYAYYACTRCNCLKSLQMEVVFIGPFDVVAGSINTTTHRTCPNCNKASVQMDLSSEPAAASSLTRDEDCDLAR